MTIKQTRGQLRKILRPEPGGLLAYCRVLVLTVSLGPAWCATLPDSPDAPTRFAIDPFAPDRTDVFVVAASAQSPSPTDRTPIAAAGSTRLSLIRAPAERFPGDTAEKDYFIRLPEHIVLQEGSELKLALHPSLEVLSRVCTVNVLVNGFRLSGARVEGKAAPDINDLAIRIGFPVPAGALRHGWNRISLQFALRQPAGEPGTAPEPGAWTLRREECRLTVAYERQRLFPELQRFPHSMAEERLLRDISSSRAPDAPVLSLLVPRQRRDVHLRACAVIGARLGQLGYLNESDCRVALIDDWEKETAEHNSIIVCLRDELDSISVPRIVKERLSFLKSAEGCVAEFISGTDADQKRHFLISGADEVGLEKAILTVGNAHALAKAPPNPAVIDEPPAIPPDVELKSQPTAGKISLSEIGVSRIMLSGIGRSEQSVSGWRLPPACRLASGTVLHLAFSHSKNIVGTESSFEVLVNGTRIGSVALTPDAAASGSARIRLPDGLRGRDPMLVTFRGHLNVGPVECAQQKEELPGLIISTDSAIEAHSVFQETAGLESLTQILLSDNFLRRTVFLVPAELSLEELQTLFYLSMHLGKNLPSSPILWPEVVGYSPQDGPATMRLRRRSVLLLGSVAQWNQALPADVRLPIEMPAGQDRTVHLQRRAVSIAAFEPSLAFMHLIPSPWSQGEGVVAVGSWNGFATPAVKRMLTDPDMAGKLYGNICALDANGRVAAYDTRMASRDSLVERIQRHIPVGLTVRETNQQIASQRARLQRAGRANTIVFYACGGLFALLVAVRLFFLWERAQLLRSASERKQPLESR